MPNINREHLKCFLKIVLSLNWPNSKVMKPSEISSTAGFLSDLLAMAKSQRAQSPRTQARMQSSSCFRQFLPLCLQVGFLELCCGKHPSANLHKRWSAWPTSKCSLQLCVNQICLEDGQVAWNSELNHMLPPGVPGNEGSNGANNLLVWVLSSSWAKSWFFLPWGGGEWGWKYLLRDHLGQVWKLLSQWENSAQWEFSVFVKEKEITAGDSPGALGADVWGTNSLSQTQWPLPFSCFSIASFLQMTNSPVTCLKLRASSSLLLSLSFF